MPRLPAVARAAWSIDDPADIAAENGLLREALPPPGIDSSFGWFCGGGSCNPLLFGWLVGFCCGGAACAICCCCCCGGATGAGVGGPGGPVRPEFSIR